jgi:hypothetical protein
MTAEGIQVVTAARESLAKRSFEVARVIAESTRPSVRGYSRRVVQNPAGNRGA